MLNSYRLHRDKKAKTSTHSFREDMITEFMNASSFKWKDKVQERLDNFFKSDGFFLNLEDLDIKDKNFNDSIVPFIKNNSNIRKLDLSKNALSNNFCEKNHELNIDTLIITDNGFSEEGAKSVSKIEAKNVDISENPIGSNGIKYLCHNKKLKLVVAKLCEIQDDAVTYINSHPMITHVDLDCNNITQDGADLLFGNKKLEYVNLSGNNIDDFSSENIVNNNTLGSLIIGFNEISDLLISSISKNKILTELDVSGNKITGDTLKILSENTNILNLCIRSNNLEDKDIKYLIKMNLESLDVSSNYLTKDGSESLIKMNKLKFIRIDYNSVEGKILLENKHNAIKIDTNVYPENEKTINSRVKYA